MVDPLLADRYVDATHLLVRRSPLFQLSRIVSARSRSYRTTVAVIVAAASRDASDDSLQAVAGFNRRSYAS